MSYDRAEFASSKFVNAIGDKKDVQFAGKDLRSFRTSPNNLHGVSYDELNSSPSSTTTSSSSTTVWLKELNLSCFTSGLSVHHFTARMHFRADARFCL